MRSKFKKALAILASAAMCGSMLLNFPSDTFPTAYGSIVDGEDGYSESTAAGGIIGDVNTNTSDISNSSNDATDCTCETKCAEDSTNSECAVCVADLTACTGTEAADTTYPYAVVDTEAGTVTIDGTLGGKTTATEDDITALVDAIKGYVDSGITTITVTDSEPALYNFYDVDTPAVSVAIFRLTEDSESSNGSGDPDSPYCGKIDLILQDVTEIVEMEFNNSFALNSITLPKVTKLADKAFTEILYLRTITFGSVLTEVNETPDSSVGAMFHNVGKEVGGCDLILNCGQMNEISVPAPDLTTNTWTFTWDNDFKSITLTHTISYQDLGNGTHSAVCSVCGGTGTEDHSGGEATCTTLAECEKCGSEYGTVDADNHTAEPAYSVNEFDSTQHDAYYSCCGATVTEDHHGTPVAVDEFYHKYEGCCGAVDHTGMEPDGICDVCGFAQYDVWVDAIRITSLNKDDVLNDSGSLKYAPDTYTLTVSGNVTVNDSFNDGINNYGIYAKGELVIIGDENSSLTVVNDSIEYGIGCVDDTYNGVYGLISVKGGMTLNATGSDTGIYAHYVYAGTNDSVSEPNDTSTINANGGSYGIRASDVSLYDANLVTATGNVGIAHMGDYRLSLSVNGSGHLIAKGEGGALSLGENSGLDLVLNGDCTGFWRFAENGSFESGDDYALSELESIFPYEYIDENYLEIIASGDMTYAADGMTCSHGVGIDVAAKLEYTYSNKAYTLYFSDLKSAINAANGLGSAMTDIKLTLLGNVTVTDAPLTITDDLPLDLAGYQISGNINGALLEVATNENVNTTGALTITDSSTGKTGSISNTHTDGIGVKVSAGTLTIEGGAITGTKAGIYLADGVSSITVASSDISGITVDMETPGLFATAGTGVTLKADMFTSARDGYIVDQGDSGLSLVVCDHSGSQHESATDKGDGTHSFTCTVCGATVTEDHTGGEATCSSGKICEICNFEYSEPDADNHKGGTATCKTQATCVLCGTSYGDLNSENHEFDNNNGICCGSYQPATLIEDTESTYNGYYEIGNAGQLMWFAEQINSGAIANDSNAVLTADIDLENKSWTPIGNSTIKYSGTFDGADKSITNFKMSITSGGDWGLFGFVNNAKIQNFSISGEVTTALTENPTSGFDYGVIGEAIGSVEVVNVHSSVNFTSEDTCYKNTVAGVLGSSSQDGTSVKIEGCSFNGELNLGAAQVDCAGGIAAYVWSGHAVEINNCLFSGEIISEYNGALQLGGFMGYYRGSNLTVTNCLSIGTITSENSTLNGMFVGVLRQHSSANTKIVNNYYTGIQPFGNSTESDDITDGHGDQTVASSATAVTKPQLVSGEVAYLLGEGWGQTLKVENRQDYPVPGGTPVTETENSVIYDQHLNFGADLSMEFYVAAYAKELDPAKLTMKFIHNGVITESTADPANMKDGFYVFTLTGIDPQCMGDGIDAYVYYNDVQKDEMLGYTVEENLNDLLEERPDDVALVDLINAALAYGKAIEGVTGHSSLTGNYTVEDVTIPEASITLEAPFTDYTVRFDMMNCIEIGVTLTNGNRLYLNGEEITDDVTDGTYTTAGIAPTDFLTKHKFEVRQSDGTTVVKELAFSVNDYLYVISQSSPDENMVNLAKGLYNYGLKALYYNCIADLASQTAGSTVEIKENGKIIGDGNEYNLSLNITEDATVILDVGTGGVKLGGSITVADGKTLRSL